MKIIAYAMQNSGPSFHRTMLPMLLMNDVDVKITNVFNEADYTKGCDIVFYNRILGDDYAKVKQLQSKYGFRICLDIDDHWQLDPHHILYDEYQSTQFAQRQTDQIKAADIVMTTHSRLATEIEQYNRNVHICPNAIPHVDQFDIETEPHHLTRLFWQGSITHREDIALLRTPIDLLGPIAPKIKMVMAGFTDGEPEWHHMVQDYTARLKHQYRLIEGRHVNEYYSHYKHADICLVPLLNSPFNRHKSNLKVLEAANLGLPVVASHVNPYLGLPVLYAKNSGDWVKHITRLVGSRKRQKEAGAELKEYCDTWFNFDKINRERKQILEYHTVTA